MTESPDLASEMAALRAELSALRDAFATWRKEVYEPGLTMRQASHNSEIESDARRWEQNEEAHRQILARLDLLNGFRNRIMGIGQLLLFAAPLVVAIWALFVR